MWHLGVDPGASGALALLGESGEYLDHVRLSSTPHDVAAWVREVVELPDCPGVSAMLERVGSRPGQGVASTFKFGWSAGFVEALLIANCIRYDRVTPAKWQQALGCRTKGNKNITKAAAQRRWPTGLRITHAVADALLIAEYGRQKWHDSH